MDSPRRIETHPDGWSGLNPLTPVDTMDMRVVENEVYRDMTGIVNGIALSLPLWGIILSVVQLIIKHS
jgi:hypothetical protein